MTVQVSLSDDVAAIGKAQANSAGFGSVDDYVARLITSEQRRRAQLHSLLLEGEKSGLSPLTTRQIIESELRAFDAE